MPLTSLGCSSVATLLLGGVTFTVPGTYYAALSTTPPTQTSSGGWNFTEPSSGVGGYSRVPINNSTENFGSVSVEPGDGFQLTNKTAIAFSTSSAAWSTGSEALRWFGFFDASDQLWLFGECSTPYVVDGAGVAPTILAGQFIQSVV